MYDSELMMNFKIRSTSRLNRPIRPFPTVPGNFTRRPFPVPRNRMVSGRYPNRGGRPFLRPVIRPDFSESRSMPPDYRNILPPLLNPRFPITPPGVERSEVLNIGMSNPSNNRIVHYPIPKPVNNTGGQNIIESSNLRPIHLGDPNLSELWIEAMAPNRRIYYYNARTREAKWEKPLNARIIDLEEIKRLTSKPVVEQTQNLPQENQNFFVKSPPGTCINPCFPGPENFMMPQRFIFPPPPNICPSPQIICTPPIEPPFQNTSVCRFNIMVPPPIFPLPVITGNIVPKSEDDNNSSNSNIANIQNIPEKSNTSDQFVINEEYNCIEKQTSVCGASEHNIQLCTLGNTCCEKNVSVCSITESKTAPDVSETVYHGKNEESNHREKRPSDFPSSESKIPLCNFGKTCDKTDVPGEEYVLQMDIDKISDKNASEKDTTQMDIDKSADCKVVNSNSSDLEDTTETAGTPLLDESKTFCSEDKINKEKIIDKSRPVSSTPVPGTCWSVVWTGDKKVFFYNSQIKLSVWERPEELQNRLDVDKLIETPLLPEEVKSNVSSDTNTVPFNTNANEFHLDSNSVSSNLSTASAISNTCCVKKSYESSAMFCVKKLKKDDEAEEISSDPNQHTDCETNGNAENESGQSASQELPHELKVKTFREMLVEKKVSAFATWEKELHKIVYDSRYLLLPSKERKQVFESYIQEKLEEEKNDRYKELQNQREKFRSLLKEAGVNSKSRFSNFAQRYGKDMRFKSIEKIKQKEHMFNQYVLELTQIDKEREKRKLEQKKKFFQLLGEQKKITKDTTWAEIEKQISDDERYKSVRTESLKKIFFEEYINEKQLSDRANTSIRNREEQVKRDLYIHLKDREREQELHKRKSAVSNFKALLNDLIKSPDIRWHSAKKSLKEDHRWDYSKCLENEEKEGFYNKHIDFLNSKKREQFHCLLDDISDITLKTSWLDIRKVVLSDPRCSKFSSSERKCEKEFKDYLKQKILAAKNEFKQLLKETKLITYKSKSLLKNSNHLKDIEDVLAKDKRYLILECMRSERKEILLSYIDSIHDKGPPPPPTASDPSNRK